MKNTIQAAGVGVAVALFSAVAGTHQPVLAQVTPLELDPGVYKGSLNFTGGFNVDLAAGAVEAGIDTGGGEVGGTIVVDAAINGPAEMLVSATEVSGNWSIDGTGTTLGSITGTFGGESATLNIDGGSIYSGSGTFNGPPDGARLDGTFNGTTTVTISGPFGAQSATTDDSQPFNVTLTEPVGDCANLFARVDLEITQQVEQVPGATATVIGIFSASSSEADELFFTESEILSGKISALWNRIANPLELSEFLIPDTRALLEEVEAFEDDLDVEQCRIDPDFANVMTLLVADLIATMSTRAGDSTAGGDLTTRSFALSAALRLGLRAGAIGSGAKQAARAAQLEADAQSALTSLFREASTEGDLTAGTDVALTAEQFGWELVNDAGLTTSEYLTTLGEQ